MNLNQVDLVYFAVGAAFLVVAFIACLIPVDATADISPRLVSATTIHKGHPEPGPLVLGMVSDTILQNERCVPGEERFVPQVGRKQLCK